MSRGPKAVGLRSAVRTIRSAKQAGRSSSDGWRSEVRGPYPWVHDVRPKEGLDVESVGGRSVYTSYTGTARTRTAWRLT